MGLSIDREKVIEGLEETAGYFRHLQSVGLFGDQPVFREHESHCNDAIAMLKEQENLLGIHQTADSITFISTGTAQQGEARGISLGKVAMREWLEKELLYRGMLTEDIRKVFELAKLT